jgi:hypothetical protein
MSMKRAVGYCGDTNCDDYAIGVFLLNHGETFYCPRCRAVGSVVAERGISYAKADQPYKEVRVEFNYDPINGRFREIGIVRDEAIRGSGSQYTLLSPLIKTENRALKVAEAILANLQRYADMVVGDYIPRTTETIISFDEDINTFTTKLNQLGDEWENSNLSQKPSPPPYAID